MNYLPNDITTSAPAMPSNRYVLPSFEERTPYGYKRQDPYAKLFEDRIIFLGTQVDDASADDIMAQLLVLEAQDPERDITLYINSPGGSFTAMTAIYDTMQFIRPEIQTVCLGQAASAAAVLLAAGTPGKRLALPNARVLIHQPALSGQQGGQASDIEIHANEVMRMREWTAQTLALHSGKTYEEVDRSIERDNILTAAAALEYGLVDKVLESRKLRKPATNTAISHTYTLVLRNIPSIFRGGAASCRVRAFGLVRGAVPPLCASSDLCLLIYVRQMGCGETS